MKQYARNNSGIHDSSATDRYVGALSNFVMCVEMFFFALAHHFAFGHAQFPRVSSTRKDKTGGQAGSESGRQAGRQ